MILDIFKCFEKSCQFPTALSKPVTTTIEIAMQKYALGALNKLCRIPKLSEVVILLTIKKEKMQIPMLP